MIFSLMIIGEYFFNSSFFNLLWKLLLFSVIVELRLVEIRKVECSGYVGKSVADGKMFESQYYCMP